MTGIFLRRRRAATFGSERAITPSGLQARMHSANGTFGSAVCRIHSGAECANDAMPCTQRRKQAKLVSRRSRMRWVFGIAVLKVHFNHEGHEEKSRRTR